MPYDATTSRRWNLAAGSIDVPIVPENGAVTVRWLTLFFDTPRDSAADATAFWQEVTKTALSPRRGNREEFATLLPETGDAYLRVQEIDSDTAGHHLDVHADDVEAQSARAAELGAVVVDNRGSLVVMRSPGGLTVCVVADRGERTR